MFKLCCILAIIALADAQRISSPFAAKPLNPFLANHLTRQGYYNRNVFDSNYQQNYFRRAFRIPVNTAVPASHARIISQTHDVRPNGAYEYVYETENGIRGQERGIPKQVRIGKASENVEGSYTYTSPEGLQVLVEYGADEDGFHPQLSYGGVEAQRFINSPAPASTIIHH